MSRIAVFVFVTGLLVGLAVVPGTVAADDEVTLSGNVTANGTVGEQTIKIYDHRFTLLEAEVETEPDGSWNATVDANDTYDVVFAQRNSTRQYPNDGTVDYAVLEYEVNASTGTDLGTLSLPSATHVDIQVSTEDGGDATEPYTRFKLRDSQGVFLPYKYGLVSDRVTPAGAAVFGQGTGIELGTGFKLLAGSKDREYGVAIDRFSTPPTRVDLTLPNHSYVPPIPGPVPTRTPITIPGPRPSPTDTPNKTRTTTGTSTPIPLPGPTTTRPPITIPNPTPQPTDTPTATPTPTPGPVPNLTANRTVLTSDLPPGETSIVYINATADSDTLVVNETFTGPIADATVIATTVEGQPVSPTVGEANENGTVVTLDAPTAGDSVGVAYLLTVDDTASVGAPITIQGQVTGADTVVLPPASLQVIDDDSLSPIAAQYDSDGDGTISIGELGTAARDYSNGKITIQELAQVAIAYART